MALHTLEPERATLHGHFSRELPPVLTIEPGDTVRYRTLDAGWNLGPSPAPDEPSPKFEPRDPELDSGHCLVGPVAIRGAEPGMTLAVHIEVVRVGSYGWTAIGGWPHEVNQRFGIVDNGTYLNWTLDADAGTARDRQGHIVALRPFMGVMGVAPADPGRHPTPPPRATGGNIDCKELVAGTTLFLPVAIPGALFSVGDGHGVQGDGEACVTAIECPMERVELRFELLPELHIAAPRARTPNSWITFGLDSDLDVAALIALEAMVDLMCRLHGLERQTALGLASLVVDLRVTQIVNGVKGVHAVLPDGAVRMEH